MQKSCILLILSSTRESVTTLSISVNVSVSHCLFSTSPEVNWSPVKGVYPLTNVLWAPAPENGWTHEWQQDKKAFVCMSCPTNTLSKAHFQGVIHILFRKRHPISCATVPLQLTQKNNTNTVTSALFSRNSHMFCNQLCLSFENVGTKSSLLKHQCCNCRHLSLWLC